MINQLIQVVKNWDIVAQPIQVSKKSRGLDHDASNRVAGLVRDLAVHLFNDHDKLDFSQKLTNMLQEVFAEVGKVAERIADDVNALDEIAERRKLSRLLEPISDLCKTALENAERHPSAADKEAQKVMNVAPQFLSNLVESKPGDEILSQGRDELALTLMHCAVVYGNNTEKWKTCVSFLEEALKYAASQEVESRLNKNLATVRNNDRLLGDLTPISSPPSLRTFNGIGFTLYGSTDTDKEIGSYLSTYYFIFLLIPVFPICRYKVISTGGGYQFLGKAPLRTLDKWHLFISLALLSLMVFSIVSESGTDRTYTSVPSSSGPSYSSPSPSYDNQSNQSSLSDEIKTETARVKQMEVQIKDMDDRFEEYKRRADLYQDSGMVDEYNMLVPQINSVITERNALYEEYKGLIDDVNSKVERYNSGYR